MHKIPVYLVVGFLGSGKTTLLKRLVHAVEDKNFVFVVNEFSAVDVDAAQIESEGAPAIAVAGGSIFCRCLITEFVTVMRRISDGFSCGGQICRPQGVVIEASGMADPRSIGRLLTESGLENDFFVAGITAVVDPGVMIKLLMVLPNIKAQIQCADLILLNKVDLHTPEMVDSVTAKVAMLNPSAQVVPCVQCEIDCALVLRAQETPARELVAEYNLCRDPHFERKELRIECKPELRHVLEMFHNNVVGLYRAKGFVECTEGWFFIDWSEGGLTCNPVEAHPNSCLTIISAPDCNIQYGDAVR